MHPYDWAKKSIAGVNNPVIVDTGAERGDGETIFFCELGNDIKVYAIEADIRTYNLLVKLEVKYPNLKTYNFAVTNENKEVMLFQSGGKNPDEVLNVNWTSASSIMSRERMRNGDFYPWMTYEEVQVQGRTLDAWANEVGILKIDFLWVDIEGASHLLIEGAVNILSRTSYFYIEAFDWVRYEGEKLKKDIIKLLPNFNLLVDYGTDLLFKNKVFL